jgi:hypothetical protein
MLLLLCLLGLLSLLGGHGIFDRYCNYQALRWYVTETRACATSLKLSSRALTSYST